MGNHSTIIKDVGQLVEWLAKGEKPASDWRIGTEHEKFLFHRDSLRPVACLLYTSDAADDTPV